MDQAKLHLAFMGTKLCIFEGKHLLIALQSDTFAFTTAAHGDTFAFSTARDIGFTPSADTDAGGATCVTAWFDLSSCSHRSRGSQQCIFRFFGVKSRRKGRRPGRRSCSDQRGQRSCRLISVRRINDQWRRLHNVLVKI